MHIYLGKGKVFNKQQDAVDHRFFARSIIRHTDFVTKETSYEYLQNEAERTLLEAMDELELAFSHPLASKTDCNHVFMCFVPTVCIEPSKLEESVRSMALRYGMFIAEKQGSQAQSISSSRSSSVETAHSSSWIEDDHSFDTWLWSCSFSRLPHLRKWLSSRYLSLSGSDQSKHRTNNLSKLQRGENRSTGRTSPLRSVRNQGSFTIQTIHCSIEQHHLRLWFAWNVPTGVIVDLETVLRTDEDQRSFHPEGRLHLSGTDSRSDESSERRWLVVLRIACIDKLFHSDRPHRFNAFFSVQYSSVDSVSETMRFEYPYTFTSRERLRNGRMAYPHENTRVSRWSHHYRHCEWHHL